MFAGEKPSAKSMGQFFTTTFTYLLLILFQILDSEKFP